MSCLLWGLCCTRRRFKGIPEWSRSGPEGPPEWRVDLASLSALITMLLLLLFFVLNQRPSKDYRPIVAHGFHFLLAIPCNITMVLHILETRLGYYILVKGQFWAHKLCRFAVTLNYFRRWFRIGYFVFRLHRLHLPSFLLLNQLPLMTTYKVSSMLMISRSLCVWNGQK